MKNRRPIPLAIPTFRDPGRLKIATPGIPWASAAWQGNNPTLEYAQRVDACVFVFAYAKDINVFGAA
jgi:hypothetical protein